MDNDMELKIRRVIGERRKLRVITWLIFAVAVLYLIYLIIFKMDYRIRFVVGGFASLLLTVSVFVVYGVLAFAAVVVSRLSAAKIAETLSKECDPFLYEACLNRLPSLFFKDRVMCNRAVAQYYQGEFEQSMATFRQTNVYKLKGMFKVNYYMLMSALYFRSGMGMQVKELENTYRAGMKKRERKWFEMMCAGNNLTRALENRDYESAFRFLLERQALDTAAFQKWHRVIYCMNAAKIYAGQGEKGSAKLNLMYVIEHGGRLFYVEEAKKMLEEL